MPLMGKGFSSEKDLAAILVGWLQDQGWEVYQEVQCGRYGGVCDIVAVRYPVTWAIECKMTLSMGVIGQAYRWKSYANYTSVCVPDTRSSGYEFTRQVMKDYGIGKLSVLSNTMDWRDRVVQVNGSFNRRISMSLKQSLCDEQKTWAMAGNAEGKRFTPFQNTKSQIQTLVKRKGQVAFKDLVSSITHHYASDIAARVSLKHWIENGIIENVIIKREGKKLFVEWEEKIIEQA
jgi:hypothetical protein